MQTDLDAIASWIASVEKQSAVWSRAANAAYSKSMNNPTGYMSIEELSFKTGGVDWRRFVTGIGMPGVSGVYLWAETLNFIDTLASFAHLPSSGDGRSGPPASTNHQMTFYYIWRLAMSHYNKLSKEYYELWQSINQAAVRSSFEEEDEFDKFQQDCVEEMGLHLPYLSGNLYVKYALNGKKTIRQERRERDTI
jgi:hypothetical protein